MLHKSIQVFILRSQIPVDMSVRNGSIGGGGAPRGEPNRKRASPTSSSNDPEYSAAVGVLNEQTMSEACALLLSDNPDNQGDYEQLLEILEKCKTACKVVEKHAPAVAMPMLPTQPQQRGPHPASRTQALPSKPKAKTMVPPRRTSMGVRPAAKKGGALPGAPSHPLFAPPSARKIHRETSDSSFASNSSSGSGRSTKKPRISPPTSEAPPPSAMSFLAALNSQRNQTEERASESKEKAATKRKRESPTKSREPPPPVPGSRKQPSRSSRK